MALAALGRMYRPKQRLFAFRLRKRGDRLAVEGVSRRYTAVALIGLADETGAAEAVLQGHCPADVAGGLIDNLPRCRDLGQAALTLWAARAMDHRRAAEAIERLRLMDPAGGDHPTVEVAWALAAVATPHAGPTDAALAGAIARRLVASLNPQSQLMPHFPAGAKAPWLRSHVTCFADQVYPIHALAHYHLAAGSAEALDAACRCAARMCELQGPAGQWWWHYDVRTGRLLEGYPVYAVHQDSMAPMALLAARAAGGADCRQAISRGLAWLARPPETSVAMVDLGRGVIWRNVARREPGKVSRAAQALASRAHPALRLPGLDLAFPPVRVAHETRPYHMGWILHAARLTRPDRQGGTGLAAEAVSAVAAPHGETT